VAMTGTGTTLPADLAALTCVKLWCRMATTVDKLFEVSPVVSHWSGPRRYGIKDRGHGRRGRARATMKPSDVETIAK
jgi:hypothetical protein